MILILRYSTLLNFDVYMLLCRNNALKEKPVHSSIACCVPVFLYKTAKHCFVC
jgi:hypothetical protein